MNTAKRCLAPAFTNDIFQLKLIDFHAHRSGGLRGFATIEMLGGLWTKVPIFLGRDGVLRAKLPSHPKVEDGRVVKAEGQVQYARDFFWMDVPLGQSWARSVGALVAAEFPETLDP